MNPMTRAYCPDCGAESRIRNERMVVFGCGSVDQRSGQRLFRAPECSGKKEGRPNG